MNAMDIQHRNIVKATKRTRSNALLRGDASVARKTPAKTKQSRYKGFITALSLALAMVFAFGTTANAASKVTTEVIHDNGKYTVFALDEGGNVSYRNETVDWVHRDYGQTMDYDPKTGEYFETDVIQPTNTDKDEYTEDILASLTDTEMVRSSGKYVTLVLDESGNVFLNNITITHIRNPEDQVAVGKDKYGNIVVDDATDPDENAETVVSSETLTATATSNGTYTVFAIDDSGNVDRRNWTIKNVNHGPRHVDPDDPNSAVIITPDITALDTDEDYTEEIIDNLTDSTQAYENGKYAAFSYDEAGNVVVADIEVHAFETVVDDGKVTVIVPEEGVEDTGEDYSEVILSMLSDTKVVKESGIYAAIATDRAEIRDLTTRSVAIGPEEVDPENPQNPDDPTNPSTTPSTKYVTIITPDTEGTEDLSTDGNEKTDSIIVYENGYYAVGPEDNVGNFDMTSYRVRNIGAPNVVISANPESLVNKIAQDGTVYGEATITFKVEARDDSPLATVKFKDEQGNEYPLATRTGKTYVATVTQNGNYYVAATDVNGREGDYPVIVDYIFHVEPQLEYEAVEGESVTFDANVVDGTAESYQWFKTGPDGNFETGIAIDGATNPSYTIKTSYTDNDTYYVVAATRDAYTMVSKPIHLSVYYPPRITASPYRIAAEGMNVNLSVGTVLGSTYYVTQEGNPSNYTYQWYYATSANAPRNEIRGATSANYSFTTTAAMDGWYFFVEMKSDKWTYMSDAVILQVFGAPSAPKITGRLANGTIIPDKGWAIEEPLYIELGSSEVSGSYDIIKYYVSTDNQQTWTEYKAPLEYTGSQEGTMVYAKAVNTGGAVSVDSLVSEHTVNIELEDPTIPPPEEIPEEFKPADDEIVLDDEGNVIKGVTFKQNTWTNKPVPVSVMVKNWSGVDRLSVFFKGEGESEFHEMLHANGTAQYQLNSNDGAEPSTTTFVEKKLQTGLWRITFCAPQNGYYYVYAYDRAGRGFVMTDDFEVKSIDYDIPTVDSATLDSQEEANEKNILVRGAKDAFSASKYGFSQLWGYAAIRVELDSTEVIDPSTIAEDKWVELTAENSTYTTSANGVRVYDFDINLQGNAANGLYHVFARDTAGNASVVKKVEVTGLFDKMRDVRFDGDVSGSSAEISVVAPDIYHFPVTFIGQAKSLTAVSSDEAVVIGSPRLDSYGLWYVDLSAVDFGTADVELTLKDYDGTTYTYTLHVTTSNMKPEVTIQPEDENKIEGMPAAIVTQFRGANMNYQWYVATSENGEGTPIANNTPNYSVNVEDSADGALHTVTLNIGELKGNMDGWYFWCVAKTSENDEAHTTATDRARTGVLTKPSPAIISAKNSDNQTVISGKWTHGVITFTFGGSNFSSGTGVAGYEFRYEGEREWSTSSNDTLDYSGDTHSLKLYVRAFNKLSKEQGLDPMYTEETMFEIKLDTVLPSMFVTGNPTDWVSEDQPFTVILSDADSGISDETADVYAQIQGKTAKNIGSALGNKTFEVVINKSGDWVFTAHDVAGNAVTEAIHVGFIDKEPPTFLVSQDLSDGRQCRVQVIATDDASQTGMFKYQFNEAAITTENWTFMNLGSTATISVWDAAGNKTTKNVKIIGYNENTGGNGGNEGGNGGGGSGGPVHTIINDEIINVDGFTFGLNSYMTETGETNEYEEYSVNGSPLKAYQITVNAEPYEGGYLYGYAKLSTGQRLPLYWDERGTETVTNEAGKAYVYLAPSQLTTSVRNGSIAVTIIEYEDETLAKKLRSDTMSAGITVDIAAPVVSISLNQTTMQVTVTARDTISGLESVKYSLTYSDETVSGINDYTEPFTIDGTVKYVTVYATDNVGNSATVVSADLLEGGTGGEGGASADKFGDETYYYRSSMFNFWLIGSNKTN